MKKYNRTFHLPFSPSILDKSKKTDDKTQYILNSLLNTEVVITEKLDGSNCCWVTVPNYEGVYGRTHSAIARHETFNRIKGEFYQRKHSLKDNCYYYFENCFAIHSIEYTNLSDFYFLIGIYDATEDIWLSVDSVIEEAKRIDVQTAPILFRGVFNSEEEINDWMKEQMTQESTQGGDLEGFVIRNSDYFEDEEFNTKVLKYVRKDHVQSDVHWKVHWKPQDLSKIK